MWRSKKSALDHARKLRFEEIMLPHLNAAYNLARWLTRNQDSEDLVQEAYTRAYTFFDTFRGGDARAWLLTIVRNACYTWLQHQRTQELQINVDEETLERETASRHETRFDDPEVLALRRADRELIDRALSQLPPEFRETIVLREMEDLSYKQIAAIAGIPIGTVMSRLARGRKMLGEIVVGMDRDA
jgi:RNA polymerase sigma-70 factor, ECF subfamily